MYIFISLYVVNQYHTNSAILVFNIKLLQDCYRGADVTGDTGTQMRLDMQVRQAYAVKECVSFLLSVMLSLHLSLQG